MPRKKAEPAVATQRWPGGRPRKYSDSALVDAALRVMEREGYAALTCRSLAQELGTSSSTLYNYVVHIEDIETLALHRLTEQLPMPTATGADELRSELLAYLLAAWDLLRKHPRVLFPPVGSASWNKLVDIGEKWVRALMPYAPDEKTTRLALSALVASAVVHAERAREYGPTLSARERQALGKGIGTAGTLEEALDGIIDLVLPGLRARKIARRPARKS